MLVHRDRLSSSLSSMATSDVSGFTAVTGGSLSYSIASERPQRPEHLPEPMDYEPVVHTPVHFASAAAAEISTGSSKALPSTPTSGAASIIVMSEGSTRKSAASEEEDTPPIKVLRTVQESGAALDPPSERSIPPSSLGSGRSRPPTRTPQSGVQRNFTHVLLLQAGT